MTRTLTWTTLVLFTLFTGCSTTPHANYGSVELIPVTGTVTMDGEPLPDAVVTFEAMDSQFAYGMTDDNGYYKLHFDTVKMGVTPGPKIVRISTSRKILGLNDEEESAPPEGGGSESPNALPAEKERVPDRYNKDSELTAEVESGSTTFDFDLKSK